MGLRLAAFLAGYHPKNTPIAKHTANASTTELVATTGGISSNVPASFAIR